MTTSSIAMGLVKRKKNGATVEQPRGAKKRAKVTAKQVAAQGNSLQSVETGTPMCILHKRTKSGGSRDDKQGQDKKNIMQETRSTLIGETTSRRFE